MGIPLKNVIQLRNASHEKLEQTWTKFKDKITVFSLVLTDRTGILGPSPLVMSKGLIWDRIKKKAMNLKAPFNSLDIDLDP